MGGAESTPQKRSAGFTGDENIMMFCCNDPGNDKNSSKIPKKSLPINRREFDTTPLNQTDMDLPKQNVQEYTLFKHKEPELPYTHDLYPQREPVAFAADKHLSTLLADEDTQNQPKAEGIPSGFCSFRGSSKHLDSGALPIARAPMPGAPDTGTETKLSDEEIWQEYRRESARLKFEQQLLQVSTALPFAIRMSLTRLLQDQLAGKVLII